MQPIFAFDFSCNKPAMTCLVNGKINIYVWPSDIDDKSMERLSDCGIFVHNRGLSHIKDHNLNQHELIIEHMNRSTSLADMITSTILDILNRNGMSENDAVIANEGFAFSAKGDAALDLSGYKYILMDRLMKAGFKKFRTYSPITIKKTAGCSKKGLGKDAMIEAFGREPEETHMIVNVLNNDPQLLKKKTNYILCMDDIADSYWCLKTCINDINGNV